MRRVGGVIALIALVACVLAWRMVARHRDSAPPVPQARSAREPGAPRAEELPAVADSAPEAATAEGSARVAVPMGRVFGIVIDAAGAGLADADVVLRVERGPDGERSPAPIERARSDANGRFEFAHDWTPGATIVATLAGFDECVFAPQLGEIARIMLLPHWQRAVIHGRVVSSRGQPVPGCVITLNAESEAGTASLIGKTRIDNLSRGEFALSVEMTGLAPVRVSVDARANVGQAERFREGKSAEFEIAPDVVVDDLAVVLEEASSVLEVIVLEPDGSKIGFAPRIDRVPRVGAEELDSNVGRGPDGSYRVPLFGGNALAALRVRHSDFAPSFVLLPSPNDLENPLTVRLSRGASLTGRVVNAHGDLQRDLPLRVWRAEGSDMWFTTTRTGADGNYEFLHVPFADLRVGGEDATATQGTLVHVDAAIVQQDLVVP